MKRTLLLKTMLLLWALIVGSLSVWADETLVYTLDGSITTGGNSNYAQDGGGLTQNGMEWSVTANTTINPWRVGGKNLSNEDREVYSKTAMGSSITKVELEVGNITLSSVNSIKLIVASDNAFESEIQTITKSDITANTTLTFTPSESEWATGAYYKFVFNVSAGGSNSYIQLKSAKFYKDDDTPTISDCDLALTPITLNFDLYNNSDAQVINYTTSSTGAVTIADNDYATFDIDETNKTITVTPTAVTPSAQTITVNQAVDDTHKAGSATFTITITDSTPIPTYTATFSVNGVTTTQNYEEGVAIAFPDDPADIGGKTFVGWTTTAIDGTTNDAPDFVTSANMGNSDITFYAVFAFANGSGSSEITKSYGFETESDPDWTVSEAIVRTEGQGNTGNYAGKINTNSTTITFNSKVKVTEFSFAFKKTSTNNNYSVLIETSEDNSTWKINQTYTMSQFNNGSYLTMTKEYDGTKELYMRLRCNNTTAVRYVDDVTIKYAVEGASYSDYCTTVVAATVARPTIEVAENPFLFSTTATITCETEGAAIKYSFDGETWNNYTDTLTITETTTLYAKAEKNETESTVASVAITKNQAIPTVVIRATGITNTNVFDGTEAGVLTASVTYNYKAIEGAVVTWSGNNDEVATIDASTGAVTLVAAGTVTFTATYAGNSDYAEKTATYEMTVTYDDPNAPGTENNPYTVAQAIEATPSSGTSSNVYIHGFVSAFYANDIVSDGSNYRYYISDDGTTDNQLLVYRGKGLYNVTFNGADDLQIGDEVVILGGLTTYNSTKEVASGNYIVSLDRPVSTEPSVTVAETSINAPAAGIDDTVAIEYANLTISDETDFEVQYYDGEGEETVAPDWMAVEVIKEDGENYSLLYSIGENTSTEPRTAYFKVYAMDDETNLVYSDLVTVTQAGVVIDYATLPFDYNGGREKLPTGMTQSGLGTDYSSSTSPNTQLKFDNSDDYVILKINEAATELSFDIKGNSFSDGTFTVQTSTDGVEYTDLEVYTDISESQEKLLLNENVRYIKWVYTNKHSGNVGLGNIKVQKRLGNATVTLASACNDGEGLYYGTYSNAAGFIVPEDLIVAEVGIDGENKLIVTEYTAGDIVPANTGVMVSSETAGAHNVVLSTGATYLPAGENRLRATGNEGITATAMNEADPDCVFYRLTMHNKTDLGFYWGAADGEAFDVVANKAYLAVPKSAGARIQGFSFEDGVITGIRNITPALSEGEEAIFDLQGRRVAKPVNGLYIVNGKKIVIK